MANEQNHDLFATAFQNRKGRDFLNAQIEKIMSEESDIQPGSIRPNDHAEGNKGACSCVGTDRQIFARLDRGMYRVLDYHQ